VNISRELIGDDHEGVGVSLILVDAPVGRGPSLPSSRTRRKGSCAPEKS